MKTYCFNYAVEGVRTFLPVFICVDASNQITAYYRAKKYLTEIKFPRKKVKVWLKNYPNMIDKEFQSSRVPLNWNPSQS